MELQQQKPRDVRFSAPLLDYGYPPTIEEYHNHSLRHRPLLLYLPGFDCTVMSPFLQFPELGTIFDIRCMTVGTHDRSTFDELKEAVLVFLQNEMGNATTLVNNTQSTVLASGKRGESPVQPLHATSTRSLYLAGESFGGILATEVALSILESSKLNLKGLVLINAATCYDRSILAVEGSAVANLSPWLYPLGWGRLVPLFADKYSLQQLWLILSAKALPSVIDNPTREAYLGRVAFSLPFVVPILSQDTIRWRLTEWLDYGCRHMSNRIYDLRMNFPMFRTLVIAGEEDRTLPSIDEAERLASILPNPEVHVVEGAGHASTCGSRIDLAALIRNRFPELQMNGSRTKMKDRAAAGREAYFGMEPRYDGRSVGLNPLLYWNQRYYRKI